jgi:hypothetical protein
LYFYVHNASGGLPFIEVNGDKVTLAAGQARDLHPEGVPVRLRHEGGTASHPLMAIQFHG